MTLTQKDVSTADRIPCLRVSGGVLHTEAEGKREREREREESGERRERKERVDARATGLSI